VDPAAILRIDLDPRQRIRTVFEDGAERRIQGREALAIARTNAAGMLTSAGGTLVYDRHSLPFGEQIVGASADKLLSRLLKRNGFA
jgi:hypothetical protein